MDSGANIGQAFGESGAGGPVVEPAGAGTSATWMIWTVHALVTGSRTCSVPVERVVTPSKTRNATGVQELAPTMDSAQGLAEPFNV